MSKNLQRYIEMGARIRMRREAMHMTQEKLAEYAGISTSYVGHIERMEKLPSLDIVIQLCDVLGVSLDYLAYGKKTVQCDQRHCALYGDLQALMKAYSGIQEI